MFVREYGRTSSVASEAAKANNPDYDIVGIRRVSGNGF